MNYLNKKNLHILFIAGWYPSRVTPKGGDFIKRHAEAVSIINKVTVIHVKSDKKASKIIEITDESINNVRTLIAYIKPPRCLVLKAIIFSRAFYLLVNKIDKFDVVHLNKLYPSGIIALFFKFFRYKNYIISEHYHIYHYPYNQKIGFIEKHLSRLITKKASYVCPVSDNLGKAMRNFGLQGKYKKIPNVIFTDIFTPRKREKQRPFTLMHASNMSDLKNVDGILSTIVKLQKHIPKFKFYLIGRNSDKYKEVSMQIGIKPDNIEIIGPISQKKLASYYTKSDVFILFSDIETFSIVIYEAFSSGIPVISTDVGGIKENFPENFGLLIEKRNEEQLLKSILKIYDGFKKESTEKMHTHISKNFSPKSIASLFDNLYRLIT